MTDLEFKCNVYNDHGGGVVIGICSAIRRTQNLIFKIKRFFKINLQSILLGNCDLDDRYVRHEGCYRQWRVGSSRYGRDSTTISRDSM